MSTETGQSCLQPLLAVCKGSPHLAADEQFIRPFSQPSPSHFVIDLIANYCAFDAVTHFGSKLVAMEEALEWAFLLRVSEVMVPFEFGDQGDPWRTQRKEGKHTE